MINKLYDNELLKQQSKNLIGEFTVHVAAEQSRTDLRNQLLRNELQTGLESVADLNFVWTRQQVNSAGAVQGQLSIFVDGEIDFPAGDVAVFGRHCRKHRLHQIPVLGPDANDDVVFEQLQRN